MSWFEARLIGTFWHATKAITWIIRLVFCAFMVIAYLGYTPLLRLDYQSPDLEVQDAQNRGIWKLKVGMWERHGEMLFVDWDCLESKDKQKEQT